jgi:glycosyltransferase involved in cell wall biosynthesis
MSIAFPSETEITAAEESDGQSDSPRRPLLSLVIPVRDAAGSLPATLNAVTRWIAGSNVGAEVVVIDDGSSDGTRATASSFGRRIARLQVLRHVERRGQLEAIRTGEGASRGELIAFGRAADLETSIEACSDLMAAVLRGAEVAILQDPPEPGTTPFPYPLPPERTLTSACFGWLRKKIARSVQDPALLLCRSSALARMMAVARPSERSAPDWLSLARRAGCEVSLVRRGSPARRPRLHAAPTA